MTLRAVIVAALLFFPTAARATGPLCCTGSGGGSGSSAFDAITGGTNTSAAMVVGTGASLATSGSGTIAATTAAALAANGTNCASGQAPLGVDASGNAESCAAFAPIAAKYITQTTDATLSGEQSLGALTTGLLLNTSSAGTGVLSQYGGTSCTNQFPRSLNASGAATCASVAAADMAASSVGGGAGGTIQDGTVDGNDLATGAVDLASGDVTGIVPIAKGGTGVTLAATGGTSQVLKQVSAGANITVGQLAFSDISGSATDAQVPDTITLDNITQITTRAHSSLSGLTSGDDHTQYALLAGRSGGQTLIGGTAASNGLTLQSTSNATRGVVTVKDGMDIGDDVPDQTTGTATLIDLSPSVDISGTSGAINGARFAPTSALSGATEGVNAFYFNPSISVSGTAPLIRGLLIGGTIANSNATNPLPVYQVNGVTMGATLTASTASGGFYQDAFVDQTTNQYTGATDVSSTRNPWAPISFLSNMRLTTTGAGDLAIGGVFGEYFTPLIGTTNAGSSITVSDMAAVGAISPAAASGGISAAGSSITKMYGLYSDLSTALPSNLTIGTSYGVYLKSHDKATTNYSLWSDSAAQLVNGGKADLGDAVGNVASGNTLKILDIAPSSNVTDTGSILVGVSVSPTSTMNPTTLATQNHMRGYDFSPSVTLNSTGVFGAPNVNALYAGGTVTTGDTNTIGFSNLLYNGMTYTTATAGASPISTTAAVYNAPAHRVTSSSGTSTIAGATGLNHAPTFTLNSTGGGATASMTITDDDALIARSSYTKTAGTALTVTTRRGLRFREAVTSGSPTITTQVGVDIENLSAATNNVGIRNADTTVYPPCVDDISGNTDYMVAKSQCTAINLTAGGARDFTVGTDQIADGYDGQIIYLFFTGSNSVKFDDADNVNLSAAGAMTMSAGDTLTLLFSATRGEWLELGRADN